MKVMPKLTRIRGRMTEHRVYLDITHRHKIHRATGRGWGWGVLEGDLKLGGGNMLKTCLK